MGHPAFGELGKGEAMTFEGITTHIDNNPALVLEIEKLENHSKKLQKENEELKIEVKVLERLLERLTSIRY